MADPSRAAGVVVLVAADPAHRRALADAFDAYGLRAIAVTDDYDAITYVYATDPNVGLLIVDDLQRGIEIIPELPGRHSRNQPPVLFVVDDTPQHDSEVHVEAAGLSDVDSCSRDATPTELLARAAHLLERRQQRRPAASRGHEPSGTAHPEAGRSDGESSQVGESQEIGSWHLDLTSGRLQWSDTMRRIYGLAAAEPVDLEMFRSRVHPDDRGLVDSAWLQALESRTSYALDHRILVDGEIRWLRTQGHFEFDVEGRPVCSTGAAYDITERTRTEQQLAAERARLQDAFEAVEASTWQ